MPREAAITATASAKQKSKSCAPPPTATPPSDDKPSAPPTPAEILADVRRVAEEREGKPVSRNLYRAVGLFTEAEWSAIFGTWPEVLRQASVNPTRHQSQLLTQVAKHASADSYRKLNGEREAYGGRYIRPDNGKRFKVAMVCADLHDTQIDRFWLRVWLETIKRVRPDSVVFGGDVLDAADFSRYNQDPREFCAASSIKFAHDQIFGPTREAAGGGAEVVLLEGNHEARVLKHLAEATPAIRAVLADLHGWTLQSLFALDRFDIRYIAKGDLAAWGVRDIKNELAANQFVLFDQFLVHHFPYGRHLGMPGVNGHHHAHLCWSLYNLTYGSYDWHQLGAGCKRSAHYTDADRKWNQGFAIVTCDTKTRRSVVDYVTVGETFAVSGGVYYERDEKTEPPV
jgi:hypothetical protein